MVGEARLLSGWVKARRMEDHLAREFPGDGRPVMVLPGMFTSDRRTTMLRRVLGKAGYAAHGWELGHNWPGKHDMLDQVVERASALADANGQPVTLVGWSLGGLLAREAAKRVPDRVSAVMTLGSPFSGDPRSNRAWRFYEVTARQRIEDSPFFGQLATKPPVPTIAIWSDQDGIIAADAARGLDGERDRAVQVPGGHLSLASTPEPLRAILRELQALQSR